LKPLISLLAIFFCSEWSNAQISGNSIILNGTSDYVEVPDNSTLNITGNLSVEAWIYPCDITGYRAIINKHWCAGDQSQFHFAIRDGFLEINWDDDGNCGTANGFHTNTAVVSTMQWYHVAFVHTNSSIALYLNGNPTPGNFYSGGNSSILSSSTSPYRIGVYRGLSGAFGGYFKGRIDEARMWNIALTSAQILARYNSALTGSEAGLVTYHNMEITGTGQNITVPNSAVSTGSVNNGKTIGTISSLYFLNNSTILNCNNICAAPSINLGNDTTLCNGHNLILNPGAGFSTYKWQDNSTNSSFNVANPGKYWVTVQNSCGITSDTINVFYKTNPAVNLGIDTRYCNATNILLNAGTGFISYIWQDNSRDSTFNVVNSGKYWVTIQNLCGFASDTININLDKNSNINLGNDTTLCLGNNLRLNPGPDFTAYTWQDNSTSGFFNVVNQGKYWVTVQNSCGSSSDTINVEIRELFIPNLITPNADNHNDSFEITKTNGAEIEVEFFNIWGSSIYKNLNYKNDWGGNNLSDGVYYYIITDQKCNKDYKGWFHLIK
jgi:gliding motility-associated-like protein